MGSFNITAGGRFDSIGATLNVKKASFVEGADSSKGTVVAIPENLRDNLGLGDDVSHITVPSQDAANRLELFIELEQQGLVSENSLHSVSTSSSGGSTWYKPWTWFS